MKQNPKKEYLLLISKLYLVVYDSANSKLLFWGTSIRGSTEGIYKVINISASSELVEGDIIYKAENMGSFDLDKPWVEGKKGYGIDEKIILESYTPTLTIYTGYISAKKPYLWRQNSRPKTLSLYFKDIGLTKKIELSDTPNPQAIISDIGNSGIIEITILDVYKVDKYDDTCIHLFTIGG